MFPKRFHRHPILLVTTTAICLVQAQGQNVTIKEIHETARGYEIQTSVISNTISVVSYDDSKVPLQRWIVLTDASGKGSLICDEPIALKQLKAYPSGQQPELVAPQQILEGEVFMADVPTAINGEVFNIATLEGEVVASPKADKFGRIVVSSGLAAGSYLLNRAGGSRPIPFTVSKTGTPNNLGRPVSIYAVDKPIRLPNVTDGQLAQFA